MKNVLFTICIICTSLGSLFAQNPSAIVDFESSSQGILIPRMLQSERNAISMPAKGLLVYQTDSMAGFYFNYGDSLLPDWKLLGEDNDSDPTNEIELPAGGTSGQILSTNGSNPLWIDLSVDEIQDADGDTKIKAVDDLFGSDYIRFDFNGNHGFNLLKNYRSLKFSMPISASSHNIYMGYKAGINDDSTANSVGIGNYALENNKGTFSQSQGHIAIGSNALRNIGLSTNYAFDNIGIGFNAGRDLEFGSENTFIGTGAGGNLPSGLYNTLIGSEAGLGLTSNSSKNTIVGANPRTLPFPSYSQSGAVKIGHDAGRNDSTDQVLHIANDKTESLIYGEFDNRFLRLNGEVNIDSAYTLPTADGSAGQVMITDGSGTTSWTTLTASEIVDSDGDTKIKAINLSPPGSDYIRFDIDNNNALQMYKVNQSLKLHTQSQDNIYFGFQAGMADDSSFNNVGIGNEVLENISLSGNSNFQTAVGNQALQNLGINQNGGENGGNSAFGGVAGKNLEGGSSNVFFGLSAASSLKDGTYNVFMGSGAGRSFKHSSSYNTVIGGNSTGVSSSYGQQYAVKLGYNAGKNDSTDHVLHIANNETESLIYGEFDNKIVGINGDLGVGTQSPQADLHVVGEASSNQVSSIIAPANTTGGDTSSLMLAEDHDGTFGILMRYDGADNKLKYFGKINSSLYGPHFEIDRSSLTRVGVGSTFAGFEFNVEGNIRVSDYAQLGSDAPKIKMKKLTGTTAASEGGQSFVAHGLTRSKILSFDVLVDDGSFTICPHDISPYNFTTFADGTNIIVQNISGESGSILSKPFTVLITYEE